MSESPRPSSSSTVPRCTHACRHAHARARAGTGTAEDTADGDAERQIARAIGDEFGAAVAVQTAGAELSAKRERCSLFDTLGKWIDERGHGGVMVQKVVLCSVSHAVINVYVAM